MTLTRDEKEYVAELVKLLRSDRSLDYVPNASLIDGVRPGLMPIERDSIADIVEHFFRRKDGKKQGRPPDTMLEKFNASARLLGYHTRVVSEMNGGKSYTDAVKTVARRNGLSPSTLKRYLGKIKTSEPYGDALSAEFYEQTRYVQLVQDEIDAGKTYDEAIQAVAKQKHIDPSELGRITKPYFEE
jgi:hypothetical protein